MYLLIDSSQQNILRFSLFDHTQKIEQTFEAQNRELLQHLEIFLQKNALTPQDVKGIAVVVGAGSFSSTRIAVTVANTWAFAHKVPVMGVALHEAEDIEWMIEKLAQYPIGVYVSATYSGEPNIGGK